MPELPEVETVRRALEPAMVGARFASVLARRPDLRGPLPRDFSSRLEGQTVSALHRRGKYLLAELSSGDVLLMHLGMSGSFRIEIDDDRRMPGGYRYERSTEVAHDHVVFVMSSGHRITFNDPRRFGSMDIAHRERLSAHRAIGILGPEPLAPEFDAAVLARGCRGKKVSLKAALSDQRIVAGLGNIYVCEALHRARLSPKRRASTIATPSGAPRVAAVRLVAAIRKVLSNAITRHASATGSAAGDRFRVYDRAGERCLRPGCGGRIRRIVQGGRSTFFCPVCQK